MNASPTRRLRAFCRQGLNSAVSENILAAPALFGGGGSEAPIIGAKALRKQVGCRRRRPVADARELRRIPETKRSNIQALLPDLVCPSTRVRFLMPSSLLSKTLFGRRDVVLEEAQSSADF